IHNSQLESEISDDIKDDNIEPEDLVALTVSQNSGKNENLAVLYARLEKLRLYNDKLNHEMLDLITNIQIISEKTLELEKVHETANRAYDPSTGLPPPVIPLELQQLREKMKRLAFAKTSLALRIQKLDKSIAN